MNNLIRYPLTKTSIDLYKKCFDLNGSPKKKENIEWQFFKNTESKCYVDIAFDAVQNKTAAIYAISSVKFKIGATYQVAAQSLDTITDIDYRGQGLFISLANNTYKEATEDNVALVYGFPNGNSIHGFSKKLQWIVLDPVPFLIRPLKTSYFTNRVAFLKWLPNFNIPLASKKNNRYKLVEDFAFPENVNDIWETFSSTYKVGLVRDKDYLTWRYINKPNENYKIIHCYTKNNIYTGFIVFTAKQKHNGKIGYIMELLYNPDNPEAGQVLLNFAMQQLKNENADCVLAWCMEHSPLYTIYKKDFFVPMPERLRPIELHFGVRAFNSNIKSLVDNRENWYISYSDSDTV